MNHTRPSLDRQVAEYAAMVWSERPNELRKLVKKLCSDIERPFYGADPKKVMAIIAQEGSERLRNTGSVRSYASFHRIPFTNEELEVAACFYAEASDSDGKLSALKALAKAQAVLGSDGSAVERLIEVIIHNNRVANERRGPLGAERMLSFSATSPGDSRIVAA